MASIGKNVSRIDVQRLERKRCYETRCATTQRDENTLAVRENNYLKTFIKEYNSLAHIQGAMR